MPVKLVEFTSWLTGWLTEVIDSYQGLTDSELLNVIANNTLYLNYLVYMIFVLVAIYVVLHVLKDIAYMIANAMKG